VDVSLTEELARWVEAQVETGLYRSSSEVVREALELLVRRELQRGARLADLRGEIDVGLADLEAGRSKELTPELLEEVKARGRECLISHR